MGRALAVIIWLLTLASVVLFFSGWWFPHAITEHGPKIDQQFLITITVVGIAFVAAQIGLGYMVWRYGADKQDKNDRATYTHGNNRLEVIWTVVTAVVFIGLAVMGQRVWAQLHFSQAPENAYRIGVYARRFQWTFHYPGRDGKFGHTDPNNINDDPEVANFVGLDKKTDPAAKDDIQNSVLVIPSGRPVELILHSRDVTHSFWVPHLRFKQDLVPGMEIPVHFQVTPGNEGQYQLACAELCGESHYTMQSKLLVVTEAEFNEMINLSADDFTSRVSTLLGKYPLISK